MTKYLDELRKKRDPKLGDWVFVNSQNEPYTPSEFGVVGAGVLTVCIPLAAAWTAFVKSCFGKHSAASTGQRKAPSPSLTRSIFVTWLNGVPYDAHDSPFLQEIKVSAAEYQTHSLAIANRHYDKDAASEVRLRELVEFCDKYSAWSVLNPVAAASGQLGRLSTRDDNVDSDDEGFCSVDPLPRRPKRSAPELAAASASEAASFVALDEDDVEVKAHAAATGRARLLDDVDDAPVDSFAGAGADGGERKEAKKPDDQLYMPEHIIAKKTVRWKNYYLIHWRGYSESERTWEPAEFFDEYCTAQTHAYHKSRVPVKIVSQRTRPGSESGAAGSAESVLYFEVQWQGHRDTSLEVLADVEALAAWASVFKEWQAREAQRLARKQKRPETADSEDQEQEGKRQPKSRRLRGLEPDA